MPEGIAPAGLEPAPTSTMAAAALIATLVSEADARVAGPGAGDPGHR